MRLAPSDADAPEGIGIEVKKINEPCP